MCVVQDEFQGHLTDARVHHGQRAKTSERDGLRSWTARETTLCLWAPRSQPPGLLAVSDIARGVCGEGQTGVRAGALNREAGAECAICDTVTDVRRAP